MLELPDLPVFATAVRVPVRTAHSEAVFFETERETSIDRLAQAFERAPGIVFHRDGIVTPREVEGTDLVHVARLRACGDAPGREFQMWIVGDQLRKGAATNGVQILELVMALRRTQVLRAARDKRMNIVVLKFGGTSVATPELREIAVARIREECRQGYAPVAVVSAMGRTPEAYATDTLLTLIGGRSATHASDLLLSCGEIISAAILAATLEERGLSALALTGGQAGIITSGKHGDAKILRVEPSRVLAALQEGTIPVVAGFQGMTEDGNVTTLGRGGTDLTAIALGHALECGARGHLYRRQRCDDR